MCMDVLPADMSVQWLWRPEECDGFTGAGCKNSMLLTPGPSPQYCLPAVCFLIISMFIGEALFLPPLLSILATCLAWKKQLLYLLYSCLFFEIRFQITKSPDWPQTHSSLPAQVSKIQGDKLEASHPTSFSVFGMAFSLSSTIFSFDFKRRAGRPLVGC